MTTTRAKRTAWQLRLWLGLPLAGGVLLAPGLSQAEAFTLSAAAVAYVLGATIFDVITARRPRFPAPMLTPLLGIAVIGLVIVAIPRALTVGLVLFLLIVTLSTYVGGLRLGLTLSSAALVGALVADALAPEADRVDGGTLVAFAVVVPLVVVLTGRLTAERRRTAVALVRLHDALGTAESRPDLAHTLDSIAASVRHAMRARIAGVVLREPDGVIVSAWTSGPSAPTPTEADRLTRDEIELGPASPFAAVLTARRPLVVTGIGDDGRDEAWAGPWSTMLESLGCESLVLVPLRVGHEVIGVLTSASTRPGPVSVDELAFLEAFADRAATIAVRARAYDRERASAKQLAQLDRQKGEFLSRVSHELRTPLTAVKGFVDTVLVHWGTIPEDRQRELLDRASINADELNRLVGQLLDFARLDAENVRINRQPMAVSDAVASALGDLTAVLAEHRVVIQVPPGVAVSADPAAFSDVLTNLLVNAAKFSSQGSPITVQAEPDGADVVVSVADRGKGIAAHEQGLVFDRFYQSPSNVASQRGTGIGLTIAKRFTELQGGRITLESEPGVGSTFFVSLPAARMQRSHPEAAGVAT
ncbi:MAG TPA: ATP-binding protein [Acidimicrobiia bacterium]|nr:ATP-binding protein [Acidimicrobiia bacterium]